jgi:ribosomal-protein-alanine N-acetyltransferase
MFFQEMETGRLFLKNISTNDREFIYQMFSNVNVNRYLFDAEPVTDINGADEIIDFFTAPEPRTQHRWILVRKMDGLKLGTCGFHCWDKVDGCCDIGYDLFPDYWGNGYMNEALNKILEFARTDMNIKMIHACVYPDNHASVRLAEKNGFKFQGKMKDEVFRGERYPHKIFSLDFMAV